jgi:hypothetical protein
MRGNTEKVEKWGTQKMTGTSPFRPATPDPYSPAETGGVWHTPTMRNHPSETEVPPHPQHPPTTPSRTPPGHPSRTPPNPGTPRTPPGPPFPPKSGVPPQFEGIDPLPPQKYPPRPKITPPSPPTFGWGPPISGGKGHFSGGNPTFTPSRTPPHPGCRTNGIHPPLTYGGPPLENGYFRGVKSTPQSVSGTCQKYPRKVGEFLHAGCHRNYPRK